MAVPARLVCAETVLSSRPGEEWRSHLIAAMKSMLQSTPGLRSPLWPGTSAHPQARKPKPFAFNTLRPAKSRLPREPRCSAEAAQRRRRWWTRPHRASDAARRRHQQQPAERFAASLSHTPDAELERSECLFGMKQRRRQQGQDPLQVLSPARRLNAKRRSTTLSCAAESMTASAPGLFASQNTTHTAG